MLLRVFMMTHKLFVVSLSTEVHRAVKRGKGKVSSFIWQRSYCSICSFCHRPIPSKSPTFLAVSRNLSLSNKCYIISRSADHFGSNQKSLPQLTARLTNGINKRQQSKSSVAGAGKLNTLTDDQLNPQQKVFFGDGGEGPVVHHTSHAVLVLTHSMIRNGNTKQILTNSSTEASSVDCNASRRRVNINGSTCSTVNDVNIVNKANFLTSDNSASNHSGVTKEQSDLKSLGAHNFHAEDEVLNAADAPLSPDVFILHNWAEGMSSEQLISRTTAFVRKVAHNSEQSDPYDSSSLSPTTDGRGVQDVEYIVDVLPVTDKTSRAGLSGALPASSQDWRPMRTNTADLPGHYAALAKSRLTGLVVATALGAYVLAPAPLCVSSLVGVCLGTGLISAAANTTNQILEAPYDAQMKRTSNRVLVRGHLTPLHAAVFAGVCGTGGLAVLWGACNPLTAGLGAVNLVLYTALYTPMKRRTIANTWMGAVVGAIPPLMGWSGSTGSLIGYDACGAWLMAGLLFAWQFPHFNALSWNLRPDYSKAGYRMMCVTDPRLCKVTCVRYSLAMLALGVAAPLLDVTTWTFAIDSTPLNGLMLYLSYRFYRDGDSRSSRNLFRFSLVHLPAVIVLMIISKKYNKEGATSAAESAAAAVTSTVPAAAGIFNSKVVYNESVGREESMVAAAEGQAGNDSSNPPEIALGLSSTPAAAAPLVVVADIDCLHLVAESSRHEHQNWAAPASSLTVMHSDETNTQPGQGAAAHFARAAGVRDQLQR